MNRIGRRSVRVAGIFSIVALACGESDQASNTLPAFAYAPADTQWVTIDGIEFPQGIDAAHPEIIEAYLFAAKHPEVLRYMPCYCGCEDPRSAHESNYDCFVDIIDRTGTVPRVSPDPMGFA
jgi:hypothetical protein